VPKDLTVSCSRAKRKQSKAARIPRTLAMDEGIKSNDLDTTNKIEDNSIEKNHRSIIFTTDRTHTHTLHSFIAGQACP